MNKKIKVFSVGFLLLSTFAFTAPVALGAVTGGPQTPTELIAIIDKVAAWFQAIIFSIGIIMIIYAGFVWMTAGGDEEKLGKGRRILIYGVIGIGIAIFAYAAKAFITSII